MTPVVAEAGLRGDDKEIGADLARKLPEEFQGKELAPLCLASTPQEAQEIEKALDKAGMDYTFDITPLSGGGVFSILFGSPKEAVLFLVPTDDFESCMKLLTEAGLSHLVVD
jgi:hypothetical protein